MVGRLNPNGSIDSTFGVNGVASADVKGLEINGYRCALLEDGKMVLAGMCGSSPNYNYCIARMDSTGKVDSTFGENGSAIADVYGTDYLSSMIIQKNGKIVLGGYCTKMQAGAQELGLARFNPDGSLDLSYGQNGVSVIKKAGDDVLIDMFLQPDGGIVSAGFWTDLVSKSNITITGVDSTGKLKANFGNSGYMTAEILPNRGHYTSHATMQQNGQVVVNALSTTQSDTKCYALRFKTGDNTGIAEYTTLTTLNVYPNPMTGHSSTVQTDNVHADQLKVFDVSGKLIRTIPISESTTEVNRKFLVPGIYTLLLSNGNKPVGSSKLVVAE